MLFRLTTITDAQPQKNGGFFVAVLVTLTGLLAIILFFAFTTNAATAPVSAKLGVSSTNLVKNGLVGHWTFDGKYMTNATATDISGSGNHGTLTNMTLASSRTLGKIGQALKFDGGSRHIDIENNSALNMTGQITLSAWVKRGTIGSRQFIVSKGSATAADSTQYWLEFTSGNLIIFKLSDGSSGPTVTSAITHADRTKWHHVVGVWDGATMKIFVDGVQDANTTAFAGPLTTTSDPLSLGNRSFFDNIPFVGSLDDIRIYNRALSALEIQSLYKAGNGVTIKPYSPNLATIKSLASFTCGTSNVTDVDGNTYNTVAIGSQCWMKQSLRTGTRINVSTAQTNNGTIEKYCYSDTASNCTSNDPNQPDGGLYQWNEAMQYSTTPGARGICPSGWHIPTHDQLTTMERNICTSGSCATDFPYDTSTSGYRGTNEGTKLKPNGTSALEVNLAGYSYSGSFLNRGSYGVLWSSSESGADAWCRYVNSGSAQVTREANDKSGGLSVRCLKD